MTTIAKVNQAGIDLLKEFEGFRSTAYQDIVGVWTIGYGFTKNVKEGDTITKAQGEKRLKLELREYTDAVIKACTLVPNENQLAAMVVFAFNVGIGGFNKSTVLKAHNKGSFEAAARAFSLWNKAGGKAVAGLTRRRAAEASLYLKPVTVETEGTDIVTNMPQSIDEERPMSKSSIVSASTLTAGTSTIALISEGSKQLNEVKESTQSLFGQYFPMVALTLVIGMCGYIVYQRFIQRKEGWA